MWSNNHRCGKGYRAVLRQHATPSMSSLGLQNSHLLRGCRDGSVARYAVRCPRRRMIHPVQVNQECESEPVTFGAWCCEKVT